MRPIIPREKAVSRPIETSVIIPIIVACSSTTFPPTSPWKLFFAAPARLRPITMTIAPVTTGGIIALIQPIPAARTTSPTRMRITPVKTMPPSAPAIPPPSAPIAAKIGPRKANEEPR